MLGQELRIDPMRNSAVSTLALFSRDDLDFNHQLRKKKLLNAEQ